MSEYTYIGSELDLFAKALNWKAYWHRQMLPYVRGTVLEVGAGTGSNTSGFAESGYRRWVCLEPDAGLCVRLRANVQAQRSVEVIVGTLASLSADEFYDTIVYVDVLEHIEQDSEELRLASTHLCAGGHLLVLSPAHQWLYSSFDRGIGHQRRYSRSSLRAVAPKDLSLVSLRYLDSAGMLASLGNRLLLRRATPSEGQILFWDRYLVPLSRLLDPIFGYRVGKSILGIWQREAESP